MKKKMKLFLINVLLMVLLMVPFCIVGRIDYLTSVSDAKRAVVSLSRAGKTDEEISRYYKFSEYPHNQIFAELKKSGEFDKLVQKGREKE